MDCCTRVELTNEHIWFYTIQYSSLFHHTLTPSLSAVVATARQTECSDFLSLSSHSYSLDGLPGAACLLACLDPGDDWRLHAACMHSWDQARTNKQTEERTGFLRSDAATAAAAAARAWVGLLRRGSSVAGRVGLQCPEKSYEQYLELLNVVWIQLQRGVMSNASCK